jgi:MFS family permease
MNLQNKYTFHLLLLLTAIGLLSSDIYVTALPEMERFFLISHSQIKFTITIFFCGTIIASLIFGYISDVIGRRPMTLLSVAIFVIGSGCCLFNISYKTFLLGRFMQGVGGISILGYAIIQDCLAAKESSKILSKFGLILIFIPTASPLLGSYIFQMLGWQYIFKFIFLLSIIALILTYTLLPETNNKQGRFALSEVLGGIKAMISNKYFLMAVLIYPIASIGYWIFVTEAAFMLHNMYKFDLSVYRYIISIVIFMFAIGNLFSQKIIKQHGLTIPIKYGAFIIFIGGLCINGFFLTNGSFYFIGGNILFIFGTGMIYAPSTAIAFSRINNLKGLTATFRTSLIMLSSGFGTIVIQFVPVTIILMLISVIVIFLAFKLLNITDV